MCVSRKKNRRIELVKKRGGNKQRKARPTWNRHEIWDFSRQIWKEGLKTWRKEYKNPPLVLGWVWLSHRSLSYFPPLRSVPCERRPRWLDRCVSPLCLRLAELWQICIVLHWARLVAPVSQQLVCANSTDGLGKTFGRFSRWVLTFKILGSSVENKYLPQ